MYTLYFASFNSTLVQLKARMEAAGFNPYNSFNSTLVQLKDKRHM